MPLFARPTPEEVFDDSGLRPEQINTDYLEADVLTDIGEKINEASAVVERRILAATSPEPWPFSNNDLAIILPKYSAIQRDGRQNDQIATAQKAIKLYALHYLYDRSGQLSATYQSKAGEYKADAEILLTGSVDGSGTGGLLGELSDLSEGVKQELPTGLKSSRKPCFLLRLSQVPRKNEPPFRCDNQFGGPSY